MDSCDAFFADNRGGIDDSGNFPAIMGNNPAFDMATGNILLKAGKKTFYLLAIRFPYNIEYTVCGLRLFVVRIAGYVDRIPVEEGKIQVFIEFEYYLGEEVGKVTEPALAFQKKIAFRTLGVGDIVEWRHCAHTKMSGGCSLSLP